MVSKFKLTKAKEIKVSLATEIIETDLNRIFAKEKNQRYIRMPYIK
jgi:hypothetical protein